MELPRLEPLWNKYKERGLSVVVVEATRDTERATKFIEEHNLTYHLLENGENDDVVGDVFDVHSFPTLFLVDRGGTIMYCHLGFEAGDEKGLEDEILGLMKQ